MNYVAGIRRLVVTTVLIASFPMGEVGLDVDLALARLRFASGAAPLWLKEVLLPVEDNDTPRKSILTNAGTDQTRFIAAQCGVPLTMDPQCLKLYDLPLEGFKCCSRKACRLFALLESGEGGR